MPSPVDLTALTNAITSGFSDVTAAITAGTVDLVPLTTQVERMADALYVEDPLDPSIVKSIAQVAEESNTQIATVIGVDNIGDNRVRTDPNVP